MTNALPGQLSDGAKKEGYADDPGFLCNLFPPLIHIRSIEQSRNLHKKQKGHTNKKRIRESVLKQLFSTPAQNTKDDQKKRG